MLAGEGPLMLRHLSSVAFKGPGVQLMQVFLTSFINLLV